MLRSGGSTSGIGASSSTGPSHGFENAPTAIATSLPFCSRRPDVLESERPARSTVALSSNSPASGVRRKCIVAARGSRSGSATASSIALTPNAIT